MNSLTMLEQVRMAGMRPSDPVMIFLDDPVPGDWPQTGPSGEYLPTIYIGAGTSLATLDLTPLYALDVFLVSFREGPRNDVLIGKLLDCGVQRIEMLRIWEASGNREDSDITLEAIDGKVV